MVTNEDLLLSYPDQLLQVAENSARVDAFETMFDSSDPWLLRTTFNPQNANLKTGMIVQITDTSSVNPKTGIYLISALYTDSLSLRLAGYDSAVGRGPGAVFGTSTLQTTIYDFSSYLLSAQKSVDAIVSPKHAAIDDRLLAETDSAVKNLALIRLCANIQQLQSLTGLSQETSIQMEHGILAALKSTLIQFLARNLGSGYQWTKLSR